MDLSDFKHCHTFLFVNLFVHALRCIAWRWGFEHFLFVSFERVWEGNLSGVLYDIGLNCLDGNGSSAELEAIA